MACAIGAGRAVFDPDRLGRTAAGPQVRAECNPECVENEGCGGGVVHVMPTPVSEL